MNDFSEYHLHEIAARIYVALIERNYKEWEAGSRPAQEIAREAYMWARQLAEVGSGVETGQLVYDEQNGVYVEKPNKDG